MSEDSVGTVTIVFNHGGAIPEVNINGVTPFQVLLASAVLDRIADKVMTDLEAASEEQSVSPLVIANRLPLS